MRSTTLWLVVMREIRTRARNRAFVTSTLMMLLLVLAGIVVPTLFAERTTTYRIGLVGDGNQAIVDTASALTGSAAFTNVTVTARGIADVAAAERALDAGELDAALVDGEELVLATPGGMGGSDVQRLLQQAAGTMQVEAMVGQGSADRVVAALTDDALAVRTLSGTDASETEGRAWIAYGGLVLTYFFIVGYAMWTLGGVTEEKSNRVIELLLAAARPWELLAGKILGISLIGLGQFVLTIATALIAIRVTGAYALPAVPVDLAGVLTLWILLGFGVYMVMCGAAGALASRPEDAQAAAGPITLIAMVSFFLSFGVLGNPDGALANVSTFVPFSAPFVVPIRAALGVLPVWQHLSAIAITLVAVVVLVRLGGRVYAGGVLAFGGRLKWRQALRRAEL